MKKLTLIISALALVLGMSQCKKPNQPTFGGNIATTPKEISFTVNGVGGQKGDFTQEDDVTSVLDYTWRNGDKIYVYSSNNALVADNTTDFSTGHYCGVLDIVSGANTKTAKFGGTINVPDLTKTLRFVHFGTGVTIDGNETDGYSGSASFATQNGALTGDNSISSKVIALCDKLYDENVSEYAVGSLQVQFGVVRFTLAAFDGTADITVRGLEKNGLTINANGAVVYTDGTTTTLDGITAENKALYYTALMPKAETTYTFTDGSKTAYKKASITAGLFYTKLDAAGESVTLNELPEGALPGEFSVSETKSVYFSKGNLYFDGSSWKFEDNQYNCRVGSTPEYGLLGWSNVNSNFGRHTSTTDVYTGAFVDWGTNSIANGGNTPNVWFTLSEDEWNHVMNVRANHENLYGHGKVGSQDGMILLPDEWVKPDELNFTPGNSAWANNYTTDEWGIMENAGAVFLPKVGFRHGTSHQGTETGYYHSSTYTDSPVNNLDFVFSSGSYKANNPYNTRYDGLSVRLAYEIK